MTASCVEQSLIASNCARLRLPAIESQFVERVYATPPERYEQTLRAAGLYGRPCIVDVGAGYGQWSLCLASLNEQVIAVEPQEGRCRFIEAVVADTGVTNVSLRRGSAEVVGVEDGIADGVLCFGVLQYVDAARFFAECARVLKPGGIGYVLGKDVGGYLCDWFEQRNRSETFDPRQVAADAFANTLHLEQRGSIAPGARWSDRIVPMEQAQAAAKRAGLQVVAYGPEGQAVEAAIASPRFPSHFFLREYMGRPFSYELIIRKP